MKIRFVSVAMITSLAFDVTAYEPLTHSELSRVAAEESVLKSPAFLATLGLQPKAIGDKSNNLFLTSEREQKSIVELIKFGANWEDKRNERVQSTRHFFNPVNGEALSAGPWVLPFSPFFIPKISGIRSPDWALEDRGLIPEGNLGVPQFYSYRWARQYFFDALTEGVKESRDKKWGLTFQSLGHVIHHIQDMAQPQHTRNDFHCDVAFCENSGLLGGVKPSFEKWTLNNEDVSQYDGYAPVFTKEQPNGFNTPRDFWTSTGGKGMADFANRNFFTAGTNVGASGFTLPIVGSEETLDIGIVCSAWQDRAFSNVV